MAKDLEQICGGSSTFIRSNEPSRLVFSEFEGRNKRKQLEKGMKRLFQVEAQSWGQKELLGASISRAQNF